METKQSISATILCCVQVTSQCGCHFAQGTKYFERYLTFPYILRSFCEPDIPRGVQFSTMLLLGLKMQGACLKFEHTTTHTSINYIAQEVYSFSDPQTDIVENLDTHFVR